MDYKWNTFELEQIKKKINKMNLTTDANQNFKNYYNFSILEKNMNVIIKKQMPLLNEIINNADKNEIKASFNKIRELKLNIENEKIDKKYINFVNNIININRNDYTEIFTLCTILYKLYAREIYNLSEKITLSLANKEFIEDKIKFLKSSSKETIEEKHIKDNIKLYLDLTNGIYENGRLKRANKICNDCIKLQLTECLKNYLNDINIKDNKYLLKKKGDCYE